jgi:hypothetical protein
LLTVDEEQLRRERVARLRARAARIRKFLDDQDKRLSEIKF